MYSITRLPVLTAALVLHLLLYRPPYGLGIGRRASGRRSYLPLATPAARQRVGQLRLIISIVYSITPAEWFGAQRDCLRPPPFSAL